MRNFTDVFFKEFEKKKVHRVLMITFFISIIWIISDLFNGNLSFKISDSLITLLLAVIVEHIIPWGKQKDPVRESVRVARETIRNARTTIKNQKELNVKLTEVVKEQNDIIKQLKEMMKHD